MTVETTRRLAAIFAADVEGYSRLMEADEVSTLRDLTERRRVMDALIASHRGRIANTAGDSVLAEFGSIVDAVQCAIDTQGALTLANGQVAPERRVNFRIGLHVGDVMVRNGDLFGDSVNVAARLQTLASAGGICISGAAHDHVRKILPLSFTDLGAHSMKNIGEPVRAYAVGVVDFSAAPPAPVPTSDNRPLQLPDKPSIAVLPFDNMGSDPEQGYFADGMTEDIITTLSHISSLFVIARNSSFAYKGKARDVREIGRQLGVRYLLEGSVRRSGDRIRITAQLVDAGTGNHLWADRYDRLLTDVFAIQDELTKEIVTALRVALTEGEEARIWQRSTENISAWGDAVRGVDHMWRGTAADMKIARRYLSSAVAHDPHYAKAFSMLAMTQYLDIRFAYTTAIAESQARLTEFTQQALALDPGEPYAIGMKANVLVLGDRFDDAVSEVKRALAISPNDAFLWGLAARVFINAERPIEGERAIRSAMRLNPFYPVNYLAVLGDALIHQLKTSEALEVLAELVRRNRNYISAHLHLAGLYGDAGELDKARGEIAEVLRINPTYRISMARNFYLSSNAGRKEAFIEALRKAGLPE